MFVKKCTGIIRQQTTKDLITGTSTVQSSQKKKKKIWLSKCFKWNEFERSLSWIRMQLSSLNLCHSETSFVKFPLFNLAQISKWKDRQIAWCVDKGEPSERLATHHKAAAADPERRVALISPDSTRWNSVTQSSPDSRTYACVGQAAAAAAAATSLFWICETSPFSRKKHMTDGAQLWEEKWSVYSELSWKKKSWIVQLKVIKSGTNSIILYRWYWTFIHCHNTCILPLWLLME